jgi:5-methylcytosine-specific restriction endonuclease McrA
MCLGVGKYIRTLEIREKARKRRVGKHHSDATKRKISETCIDIDRGVGKHLSVETKEKLRELNLGEKNPNYGKHPSEETIRKMRVSNIIALNKPEVRKKMSKNNRKEKNPNWQGGISKNPYPLEFDNRLKRKIFERDGFRCKLCGINHLLGCHHIDYDKKNCEEENLVTLCRGCNIRVNYNRNFWENYFLRCKERISGYVQKVG